MLLAAVMIDTATDSNALHGASAPYAACFSAVTATVYSVIALIATCCSNAKSVHRLFVPEQVPVPQAKYHYLAICHNYTTSGVALMSHGRRTKPVGCSR